MRLVQEDGEAESLVPPRPNLGPEPWPTSGQLGAGLGWAAGLAIVILIVAWRWRRRLRRKKLAGSLGPTDSFLDPNPSPRHRLIASSESVRGALISTFGPGWASKTTEEIAAYPGLSERLRSDEVDRLVAFLRLADRAKFAEDEPEALEDWEGWAGGFAAILAAGATSRINGK